MATNNESNSGLWFLIGAVIVAVAAILWYLNAGGSVPAAGGGDTNVTVQAPAAISPAAPAAPAASAGGTSETTSTTTTTTTAPASN